MTSISGLGQTGRRLEYGIYCLAIVWTLIQLGILISGLGPAYHPLWSDEFFYYMNALSLADNKTLAASFTYNGTGSRLFGADAHGISYPILNSIAPAIFGWNNFNFIGLNFILFLIPAILILLSKEISIFYKSSILAIFIAYPLFLFFGFSFMQEVVHIFLGTISGFLLFKVYNSQNKPSSILIYTIFILFSGTFRSLWFFFLMALIPLSLSKKQLFYFSIISLLGIFCSLIYTKFFIEPIPIYYFQVFENLTKGNVDLVVKSIYTHFKINIISYFSIQYNGFVYNSMKYIVFLSAVYFVIMSVFKKNKIFISLALIGIINFSIIFFLYDAFDGREIRTLSPLFYFYLIFLVLFLQPWLRFGLFLWVFYCFNLHLNKADYWIKERNKPYQGHELGKKEAFSKLKSLIPGEKTILLDYQPDDNTSDMIVLPIKNDHNQQIRYIIPYFKVKTIKPDYILARPWVNKTLPVLEKNGHFILYRNP